VPRDQDVSQYGRQSLWRDTAGADLAKARELAGRLELRAKAEDEVDARETGRAVGLDPSPALLTVARELAHEAGLGDRIEFREGSALQLPFPDRSFNAALCVTVLSHVPGGEAAIPELARVLRPGGRVGVFDLDTDMTAFTHSDRALTRRIVAASSDALAVDGWLARRLPSLFAQAGLEDAACGASFRSKLTREVSTPMWPSAPPTRPSRRAPLPKPSGAHGWTRSMRSGREDPSSRDVCISSSGAASRLEIIEHRGTIDASARITDQR